MGSQKSLSFVIHVKSSFNSSSLMGVGSIENRVIVIFAGGVGVRLLEFRLKKFIFIVVFGVKASFSAVFVVWD